MSVDCEGRCGIQEHVDSRDESEEPQMGCIIFYWMLLHPPEPELSCG